MLLVKVLIIIAIAAVIAIVKLSGHWFLTIFISGATVGGALMYAYMATMELKRSTRLPLRNKKRWPY